MQRVSGQEGLRHVVLQIRKGADKVTYKEASKAFGDEVPDLSLGTLELAKKAVEKQIPKKPIYLHYCAVCASDINGIKGSGNYCFRCGQAIDWSDDNGGA